MSPRLIVRPMALMNCWEGPQHWPTGSLRCNLPAQRSLLPLLLSFAGSFLDGPYIKQVAAWDGGTVLGAEAEGRARWHIWAKQNNPNKIKPFFLVFFGRGRQCSELCDLPTGLHVSESWLRQFCRPLDNSSLIWSCPSRGKEARGGSETERVTWNLTTNIHWFDF